MVEELKWSVVVERFEEILEGLMVVDGIGGI